VGGEALLVHAVRRLRECPSVGPVVVVAPAAAVAEVSSLLGDGVTVVAGGAERQDSVRLGLAALPTDVDLVLVHDAARAFVPVAVVEAAGVKVVTVPGSPLAFQVTNSVDLALAEAVLRGDAQALGQHFEGG
jgi:2-C-methyl-D-erythritol 4-phosphate cytidylyltransferase